MTVKAEWILGAQMDRELKEVINSDKNVYGFFLPDASGGLYKYKGRAVVAGSIITKNLRNLGLYTIFSMPKKEEDITQDNHRQAHKALERENGFCQRNNLIYGNHGSDDVFSDQEARRYANRHGKDTWFKEKLKAIIGTGTVKPPHMEDGIQIIYLETDNLLYGFRPQVIRCEVHDQNLADLFQAELFDYSLFGEQKLIGELKQDESYGPVLEVEAIHTDIALVEGVFRDGNIIEKLISMNGIYRRIIDLTS